MVTGWFGEVYGGFRVVWVVLGWFWVIWGGLGVVWVGLGWFGMVLVVWGGFSHLNLHGLRLHPLHWGLGRVLKEEGDKEGLRKKFEVLEIKIL